MPYIDEKRRKVLIDAPHTAGEVNYCVTKLVTYYLSRHGESYDTLNTMIGALECAKLELYRRMVAPYEDQKIEENGDVYPIGVTTSGDLVFADTPEPVGRVDPIELLGGTRGYPTSAVIRCVHMRSSMYTCSLYVGETHIRNIDLKAFTYDQIAHAVFNEDWYVDVVQSSPGSSSEAIEIHIKWAGDISVEDAGC